MNDYILPNFSAVNPQQFPSQLKTILDDNQKAIEQLVEQKAPSWDSLMEPLEAMDDVLSQFWSPISHLHSVKNNDELRAAYQKCLPMLSEYSTDLGQNKKLFKAIESIANSAQYQRLDTAQKKTIDNALRDFRLAGVDLSLDKKTRYKEIQQRLSKLHNQFENNVLDATMAWTLSVDNKSMLDGIPPHAIQKAKATAENRGQTGWLFTLEFPSFHAIMTYAKDEGLRRQMYEAFVTRASDIGPNAQKFDNSQVMDEILALRHEEALLLEFGDYAEYSLVTKMAKNTEAVFKFLYDLAKKSKLPAEQEFKQLKQFAHTQFNQDVLNPWDISYYSELLSQDQFKLSSEDLRPYFPIDKVLDGMFSIIHKLYGITVDEVDNTDVWHSDVRCFALTDHHQQPRGFVYMDLYARENKRGGAWMDECVSRRKLSDASLQYPVAYLTCNFAGSAGEAPALLVHSEVVTLFHEFGHCLHHLLTKIDYLSVSGISGVPWDAVELPSQFFENWCWHKESLDLCSEHFETGESIPDELFQKCLNAKNFQSALAMIRQLEFSIFDFKLHAEYEPKQCKPIQAILNEVRSEVGVIPAPEYNRFQHGFSHVFAGGYAAGYYSYKWAEVLSSDAFSLFEEKGIFDTHTGQAFMSHILEQGGSRDPLELFVAFRGREPSVDALLRHSGIEA